jgi:hypothetical protein
MIGCWVIEVTPGLDLIKWGRDNSDLLPHTSREESDAQVEHLMSLDEHRDSRFYVLVMFDNGELIKVKMIPETEPPLRVVVRIGDQDDYHAFDTLDDAAKHLAACRVIGKLTDYGMGSVVSDDFCDPWNYISLFWGPEVGTWVRDLTKDELATLNDRLDRERRELATS